MAYRFHVLAVPYSISRPDYSICPFTQKVVKLCRMLKERGHTVIHYGHADSEVDCTEHVSVTSNDDLQLSYGAHDWRKQGIPKYSIDDPIFRRFYTNSIAALAAKKQKNDFLLCCFGGSHKPIAVAHPDMIICEPGIGYPHGGFARFRVFESYAVMHAYLGVGSLSMNDKLWYDVVIPNSYDPADFEFSAAKQEYFLFLGRISPAKGIHIALQTVEAIGGKIVVAGQGDLRGKFTRTDRPLSEYVEMVGVVGPAQRRALLSQAKAVFTPSMYLEPFCGVHVEAMLSGTPVISTDWGAFAEYNLHGITGYRCRTFEQFTWAANNIHKINPHTCRQWAEDNFSVARIGEMYDEYFSSVYNLFAGKGWYEPNPGRSSLDWLNKYGPGNGLTGGVNGFAI